MKIDLSCSYSNISSDKAEQRQREETERRKLEEEQQMKLQVSFL